MKLYELTEQHRDLQELAEGDNDDLQTALADTMEAIEGEFNDKAVSLISVVKNMDLDIDSINTVIKKLQERKKTIENKQNSMREYLRLNMESSGISKISCPLFSITLGKGRDAVQIDDESKIPADYLNIKTSTSPMKADILKALNDGQDVPGCSIGKSKSSLRIG